MPLQHEPIASITAAGNAVEVEELPPRPKASIPIVVLCGLAVIAAMYFARDLLIPLVLAVLLALLLRPLLRRMRRLHLPDFASAAVLILAGEAEPRTHHQPEHAPEAEPAKQAA